MELATIPKPIPMQPLQFEFNSSLNHDEDEETNESNASVEEDEDDGNHIDVIEHQSPPLDKKDDGCCSDDEPEEEEVEIETTTMYPDKEHRLMSAGVICYCVAPGTNQVYFLLGKEQKSVQYMDNSHRWCSFEGGPKEHESPVYTAAREFVEETMGIVPILNNDQPFTRIEDAITMIEHQEYTYSIRTVINETNDPRYRLTFVKRIPWLPELPEKFARYRNLLMNLQRKLQIYRTLTQDNSQERFEQWNCIVEHYNRYIDFLRGHPALTLFNSNNSEIPDVQDMHVNMDFLEKDYIMLWSIPRLMKVLQQKGRYRGFRFRRSFLPTLGVLLKRLKKDYNLDLSYEQDDCFLF